MTLYPHLSYNKTINKPFLYMISLYQEPPGPKLALIYTCYANDLFTTA